MFVPETSKNDTDAKPLLDLLAGMRSEMVQQKAKIVGQIQEMKSDLINEKSDAVNLLTSVSTSDIKLL